MTAGQMVRRRRLVRRSANGGSGGGRGGGRNGRRSSFKLLLLLGGVVGALLVVGVLVAGGLALYGMSKYNAYAETVVPPEELLAELSRGGARIYDRNGKFLYEFVDEYGGLRRPVPITEIAPIMQAATVSTEDASFYENNGLNMKGLARAAFENFSPFGGEDMFEGSGGSSITQQLAKNVYIPQEERLERSIDRKLRETVIALELTKKYSKDQILEWYLNSISYGGIYVGIQAASEGYFGKSAKDLTLAEASLLAGIPQSPVAYDPINNFEAAKGRQREVLDLMVRHEAITEAEADEAFAVELQFASKRFDIDAAHFVLGPVKEELEARFGERALYQDGLDVLTTIDIDLQHIGQQIIEDRVAAVEEGSGGHNGALYALDVNTGQVLAYVASRDYFRDDIHGRNDNIGALNSPGSTLKPFTYITAFQQGWGTGTAIIDSPASVVDPSTGETFSPRNPSGGYSGIVTVASALGNSLNVPAFKAILYAGVGNVVNTLKQSGLTTLNDERGYGPALTLGGVDIRLDDLTYAYSVLAAGGLMRGQEAVTPHTDGDRKMDPVILLKVVNSEGEVLHEFEPHEERVMGANYAYMATSILSDPQNFCITYTCAGIGLADRPSAAKTGTSEPYEDSRAIGETWTFGYTTDLVAGVWAGNSDNLPMQGILSTTISQRAWYDFMVAANEHLQLSAKNFIVPSGVEEREVCWPSGKLPTDACPSDRRYKSLYATDAISGDGLSRAQDTWWQKVKIDTRTGLLAAANTPSAFVVEESRLVLPEEELEAWPGLRDWIIEQGAGDLLAPSEESSAAASNVLITSPGNNQQVSGSVTVSGRASTPNFQRYFLEYGSGKNPSSWEVIETSTAQVIDGRLGAWNTSNLSPGDYTLRIRVVDEKLGELRFTVPVVVRSGSSSNNNGDDEEPIAVISSPTGTVEGVVRVRGTASAGELIESVLEYGVGASPSAWTQIDRNATQIRNGILGEWDTEEVANGMYTLRLTVRDRTHGTVQTTVTVIVSN